MEKLGGMQIDGGKKASAQRGGGGREGNLSLINDHGLLCSNGFINRNMMPADL